MVEVELIVRTADDTLPAVPSPDFHFDGRGNQSPTLPLGNTRGWCTVSRFDCGQLEFKDRALTVVFRPGI